MTSLISVATKIRFFHELGHGLEGPALHQPDYTSAPRASFSAPSKFHLSMAL